MSPPDAVTALLPLPPPTFPILVALSGEAPPGYAPTEAVEPRPAGALRLSAGTLYRSIARMVEQGLIAETTRRRTLEDDERRRYYRITPFGRAGARAEMGRLTQT